MPGSLKPNCLICVLTSIRTNHPGSPTLIAWETCCITQAPNLSRCLHNKLKELLKYVLSPRQDVPPAALEDTSLSVEFLESAEPNLPHTASFAPLSSALQESGLVELAQSILAAVATHMCAGANLGAHANALLEKHRFDPEKGTLVTSSQFLIEMSQLFKTRFF